MSQAHLTLREFTRLIESTFEQRFGNQNFWVIAEISNLSHFSAKHTFYFHMVEKDDVSSKICAEISAVAFGSAAYEIESFEQQTGQRFQNGIQVLANVMVNFHPVHGLKLNLLKLDPSFTLGKLHQQREATLSRLLKENPDAVTFAENRFITRNHLLKFPHVIQKIAIISSESSAGLQDFRHTLEQNSFGYRFKTELFPVQVQGEDNVKPIVERLKEIYLSGKEYHTVVLVRGGGSQTDFLLFDSYQIARAIARFPVPVITGLGHQKDTSIADMMAHTALKTPTKVAEFIIAHNRAFEDSLVRMQHQMIIRVQQNLASGNEQINQLRNSVFEQGRQFLGLQKEILMDLRQSLVNNTNAIIRSRTLRLQDMTRHISSRPSIRVASHLNDLSNITQNLNTNTRKYLQNQKGYLKHYQSVFQLLSPENTLKRGFALVRQEGKIITDPSVIKEGSTIEVYLGGTEIESVVTAKRNVNAKRSKRA